MEPGQEETRDEVLASEMGPSTGPGAGVPGSGSVEGETMGLVRSLPSDFPDVPELRAEGANAGSPPG